MNALIVTLDLSYFEILLPFDPGFPYHLSYNWIEHDGRNYGIEQIIAGNHNITVAFVKRPATPSGGDWSARISVSAINGVSNLKHKAICCFLRSYFDCQICTRGYTSILHVAA